MRLKVFFSLLLSFQMSVSNAAQILTAPPTTPVEEFESALLAFKNVQSPIDHYLEKNPILSSVEDLTTRFAQAEQSLSEESDLNLVRKNYLHLLELENSSDWREEHRRLFLISYLRLIQISQGNFDERENQEWMLKSIFYLDHLEPPRDLIPPPVFINLTRFKEGLRFQKAKLSDSQKENFQKIMILGKTYSTRETILLPEFKSPVRVTFLSHFYEPQTVVTKTDQIGRLTLSLASYTNGDCTSLKASSPLLNSLETEIYSPMHCELKAQPEKIAQKDPVQIAKEIQFPIQNDNRKLSWKMTKQHWVWIGAGVLATALVMSQMNQGKGKKPAPPSETYGF